MMNIYVFFMNFFIFLKYIIILNNNKLCYCGICVQTKLNIYEGVLAC